MRKKGIVLFISLIVMTVLLILTGAYFSSLLTEKKSADNEEFVLQSLSLAEAGANHAKSELRERIRTDLGNKTATIKQASVFQAYVTNNDSLGLLRNYAYAAGDSQFAVSGGQATLAIPVLNLDTGVQGAYTANIIVTPNGNPTNPSTEVFVFPYKYTIESQGQITRTTPNIVRNTRLLQGAFSVTCRRDTFSKFALFTAHHKTSSGTTVWFTANTNFTGPVSTNERFSFANNPSAHFTEEATQHESKARFYNNGWPVFLNDDNNTTKDVPIFDKGFQRSADLINIESSISQAELKNQALGGLAEPGSNGIYVPNDGANVLGGIYIRGNQGNHSDDPIIALATDASSNPVYTITRSSTTIEITVDYANNQTKVKTGAITNTYNGIPNGIDNEGVIIYVNDDIGGLSGTVAKISQVTVSSERDIIIANNILYQEYNSSPLNAEGYNNLLGILSWGGDVRIGASAPNDVTIHGVVMAPHGVFSVDNYNSGSPRGVATLLGGVITDFYGAFGTFSGQNPISGYGRSFVYDVRMLQGMSPPYFPYLSTFMSFENGGLDNKLVWEDKGA
jgi:hypothetical protein